MEQTPGTNAKLCKKEDMEIGEEYETKHCCLLQQIQFIRNEIPSVLQQEQSLDEEHSCTMERKRKHIMDNTSTQSDRWERYYQLLCQFYEREGHCNVPTRHEEDGIKLGIWLNNQRELKKKGKLDSRRMSRLNELGIWWDVLTEQWERSFQLLRKFYEREGHCKVPHAHVEDGIKLGVWFYTQRKLMKKEKLDSRRITRLNDFFWDVVTEEWERNFQLLRNSCKRKGHCNVPRDHAEDGITMGNWLKKQRLLKKKGILDFDRMVRLNECKIFLADDSKT